MKLVWATACMLASWILVGLTRLVALRFGLMDIPNARSSHVSPMPRGGGIAIVVVTLSALSITALGDSEGLAYTIAWMAGGAVVALAGLIDDIRALSPAVRLAVHVIAALIVLFATRGLPVPSGGGVDFGSLGWVIGAGAIIWSINSYNFMDGIDGLAASECLFVAGAAVVLLCWSHRADPLQFPLLALAAASAGFLIWNFPPAKIFMGDVGSGFVGFSVAAAAFMTAATGSLSLWSWLILNGLFFADATSTLLVRLLRGERVYLAHRSHVYQRLATRWGSHRRVTIAYAVINLIWCLPWAASTIRWPGQDAAFALIALAPLFAASLVLGAGRPG